MCMCVYRYRYTFWISYVHLAPVRGFCAAIVLPSVCMTCITCTCVCVHYIFFLEPRIIYSCWTAHVFIPIDLFFSSSHARLLITTEIFIVFSYLICSAYTLYDVVWVYLLYYYYDVQRARWKLHEETTAPPQPLSLYIIIFTQKVFVHAYYTGTHYDALL